MISVRTAATDADLEAWRAVRIAVLPDERTATVEELRAMDTPERLLVVAELDGAVVGAGFADRSSNRERVFVAPRVRPDARRRGVGTALLARLVAHGRTLAVGAVSSEVDGRDDGSLAFAQRFGFEEVDRQVEQVRTLGTETAPTPPAGIELIAIAERPELLREAYELGQQGYADMALAWTVSIPLDEWLREEATHAAGSFVALAGDQIVGFSGLLRDSDQPDRAEDGLTVVRRDWRRRGLATALKQAEIAWAAANGIREIYTWTQRGNAGMRAVNERLGYENRHVSVTMLADLEPVARELAV